NEYRDLAERTARFHMHYHRALELKASTIVETLEKLDAFRKPERFEKFLLACEADAHGRTGFENQYFEQSDYFRKAFKAAGNVDVAALREQGFENLALANKIKQERVRLVKEVKG
ncbi:MAG: multifunctional CCA tRNA nucleotidyl transferase/2'3'-cyclic phosphodiesterase/2'nucleotidase/phosphatase, partial [Gammaproteobacteria bacterium]|nr:multifunctional CCA tRNA nucleotidyl transferase/2'3'-cyclic phosphodiesterase/2'nucleotidase/phosphatase [Gammaproteobacteria bacterium]